MKVSSGQNYVKIQKNVQRQGNEMPYEREGGSSGNYVVQKRIMKAVTYGNKGQNMSSSQYSYKNGNSRIIRNNTTAVSMQRFKDNNYPSNTGMESSENIQYQQRSAIVSGQGNYGKDMNSRSIKNGYNGNFQDEKIIYIQRWWRNKRGKVSMNNRGMIRRVENRPYPERNINLGQLENPSKSFQQQEIKAMKGIFPSQSVKEIENREYYRESEQRITNYSGPAVLKGDRDVSLKNYSSQPYPQEGYQQYIPEKPFANQGYQSYPPERYQQYISEERVIKTSQNMNVPNQKVQKPCQRESYERENSNQPYPQENMEDYTIKKGIIRTEQKVNERIIPDKNNSNRYKLVTTKEEIYKSSGGAIQNADINQNQNINQPKVIIKSVKSQVQEVNSKNKIIISEITKKYELEIQELKRLLQSKDNEINRMSTRIEALTSQTLSQSKEKEEIYYYKNQYEKFMKRWEKLNSKKESFIIKAARPRIKPKIIIQQIQQLKILSNIIKEDNQIEIGESFELHPAPKEPFKLQVIETLYVEPLQKPENIIQNLEVLRIKAEIPIYTYIIQERDSIEIFGKEKGKLFAQLVDDMFIPSLQRPENVMQAIDTVEIISTKEKEIYYVESRDSIEIFKKPVKRLTGQFIGEMYIKSLNLPEFAEQKVDSVEIIRFKNLDFVVESRDAIEIFKKEKIPLVSQDVDDMVIQSLTRPEYIEQVIDRIEIIRTKNLDFIAESRDAIEIFKKEKAKLMAQFVDEMFIESLTRPSNVSQKLEEFTILRKEREMYAIEGRDSMEIFAKVKEPLQAQFVDELFIEHLNRPEYIAQNIDVIEILRQKTLPDYGIECRDAIEIFGKEKFPLIAQLVDEMFIEQLIRPEYIAQNIDQFEIAKTQFMPEYIKESRDAIEVFGKVKVPLTVQLVEQMFIESMQRPEFVSQKIDQMDIVRAASNINYSIEARDSIEVFGKTKIPLTLEVVDSMFIEAMELPSFVKQDIDKMEIARTYTNKDYYVESRDTIEIFGKKKQPLKGQNVDEMFIESLERPKYVKQDVDYMEILKSQRPDNFLQKRDAIEILSPKKKPLQAEKLDNMYVEKLEKPENIMETQENLKVPSTKKTGWFKLNKEGVDDFGVDASWGSGDVQVSNLNFSKQRGGMRIENLEVNKRENQEVNQREYKNNEIRNYPKKPKEVDTPKKRTQIKQVIVTTVNSSNLNKQGIMGRQAPNNKYNGPTNYMTKKGIIPETDSSDNEYRRREMINSNYRNNINNTRNYQIRKVNTEKQIKTYGPKEEVFQIKKVITSTQPIRGGASPGKEEIKKITTVREESRGKYQADLYKANTNNQTGRRRNFNDERNQGLGYNSYIKNTEISQSGRRGISNEKNILSEYSFASTQSGGRGQSREKNILSGYTSNQSDREQSKGKTGQATKYTIINTQTKTMQLSSSNGVIREEKIYENTTNNKVLLQPQNLKNKLESQNNKGPYSNTSIQSGKEVILSTKKAGEANIIRSYKVNKGGNYYRETVTFKNYPKQEQKV